MTPRRTPPHSPSPSASEARPPSPFPSPFLLSVVLSPFLLSVILFSCKPEVIVFPDNDVPDYSGISTLAVENYVNRAYIDCIGREPTDIEMDTTSAGLEAAGLAMGARKQLIEALMTQPATKAAYYDKVHADLKARFLEGASEAELGQRLSNLLFNAYNDSLGGNWAGYQAAMEAAGRVEAVMDAREEYEAGELGLALYTKRLCHNALYDEINMNSFNFVNATFDDLYGRFPTDAEFEIGYAIIEFNQPQVLLGSPAQDKPSYLDAMIANGEWAEGMVRWCASGLWARQPDHSELLAGLAALGGTEEADLQALQIVYLTTDEYAGFD